MKEQLRLLLIWVWRAVLPAVVWVVCAALGGLFAFGCDLISSVDRSKIPPDTLGVTVSPTTLSVEASLPTAQSFTATVTGDSSNAGVTWALAGSGCGSNCGTLSATKSASGTAITYTAPAVVSSPPRVLLTATTVATSSGTGTPASATAAITITTAIAVTVAPSSLSLSAATTSPNITATVANDLSSHGVNWGLSGTSCTGATCGTLSASSSASGASITYTAPASVASSLTVVLTATSITDNTKSGTTTITVNPASTSGLFPRYLYEVNSDNTLSSYAIVAPTGQARAVTHFSITPGTIDSAALNPVLNDVYVIQPNTFSGGNATVSTYAVSAGGQISAAGSNPGGNLDRLPGTIVVDPLGRYLYGTDSADHAISLYTLDATLGLPTVAPVKPVSPDAKQLAIDATGTFLYSEDASGNLLGYQIGTAGALTVVGTSPTTHPLAAGPIAVDPQNVYMVAIDNQSQPQLFAYQISSGNLIFAYQANIGAAGGTISEIGIDPTGTYLYAIDVANNQLLGFVNSGGVFTPITGSPFTVPSGQPHHLTVDPSGKYVYVSFETTQEVWAYSIASGGVAPGALSLASKMRLRTSATDAQLLFDGPHAVSFTPEALYVANSGTANIGQFSITPSSGALTSLGSPISAGTSPYDVAADPNPNLPYLYSANQGSSNISGFQIGSTGALTALGTSPYSTGLSPEWIAIGPTGGVLFNVNSGPATLTAFDVANGTGELFSTLLGGSTDGNPVHVSIDPNDLFIYTVNSPAAASHGTVDVFHTTGAASPVSIAAGSLPSVGAVHPSGEFFYVANGDHTISEYSINASTGALTSIGSVTVSSNTSTYNSLVIEPTGKYLYVTDQAVNLIHVYSINPSTGALTAASVPTIATGTAPYGMAVDISGTYLYVSNMTSNDISIYSIDASTGALTMVGATTVSTGGTAPRGMTATGNLQ